MRRRNEHEANRAPRSRAKPARAEMRRLVSQLSGYVELAADAARLVLRLRDRPTVLDWLAIGTCSVDLAKRLWASHEETRLPDPRTYFEADGPRPPWREVPERFAGIFLEHATDVVAHEPILPNPRDERVVCEGLIGEERIGWIADGKAQTVSEGPYIRTDRIGHTFVALGREMWIKLGSWHAVFSGAGLRAEQPTPHPEVATPELAELLVRLERFHNAGVNRSCLLTGMPGTGKSTGARQIVQALGLRSVRVSLGALEPLQAWRGGAEVGPADNLHYLVTALRPQALVIDDVDRIGGEKELLDFFERAARRVPLVIATANCPKAMLGAVLRPGRIDEIVEISEIDPCLLETMLGRDDDLAERMHGWPVAYVAELCKRRDVLGRAAAVEELAEIEERMRAIEKRTREEVV